MVEVAICQVKMARKERSLSEKKIHIYGFKTTARESSTALGLKSRTDDHQTELHFTLIHSHLAFTSTDPLLNTNVSSQDSPRPRTTAFDINHRHWTSYHQPSLLRGLIAQPTAIFSPFCHGHEEISVCLAGKSAKLGTN